MEGTKLIRFEIVGIFPTPEFQKCAFYAYKLYTQQPHIFLEPTLHRMFDIQWVEYLQCQRRLLGVKLWKVNSCVIVFKDGEFFGTEKELVFYCNFTFKFLSLHNWDLVAKSRLLSYIRKNERIHVYFNISIDGEVVGTLLFQLFSDLTPLTCNNFLRLVNLHKKGFAGASIHRVVKSAWIQIGGYKLKHQRLSCENYAIPHDCRGVISMCNKGKHSSNSKQFFISLQKSHWMDYYYVAFGHLIHGADILEKIEAVPTIHEAPQVPIIIVSCGIYNSENLTNKKFVEEYENFLASTVEKNKCKSYPDDVTDIRDVDSVYSDTLFEQGLYSLDVVKSEEQIDCEENKIRLTPTEIARRAGQI